MAAFFGEPPAFTFPAPRDPDCDCAVCTHKGYADDDPVVEGCGNPFLPHKLFRVDPANPNVYFPADAEAIKAFEIAHPEYAEWARPVKEREWYTRCLTVLRNVLKRPNAEWFSVPVSDELAPGYSTVVRHPMDLGHVERTMAAGGYPDPQSFVNDVRLVFKNCSLYNREGDAVWARGEQLSKEFEAEINKLRGVFVK
eukprot:TRINITY_DN11803_c0_g1_i1.p1 TRINITY_DN11803_c0_g1~~TRINITY_DN11803_c0_g1_i1.p1  ORF type:complete len:197 (-),score=63.21 TRINITY_DN11803_c0_g1_i1:115-705(-)